MLIPHSGGAEPTGPDGGWFCGSSGDIDSGGTRAKNPPPHYP